MVVNTQAVRSRVERLPLVRLSWGVAAATLAAYPFLIPSPYYVSLAIDVLIMAIYALSFDLLLGFTGLLSLGHTLFFGLGAYTVGLLMVKAGLGVAAALPLAVVAALLAAVLLGVLSLRVSGVYFAMVTLAFSELARLAVEKMSWLTGGADGLPGLRTPAWLGDRTVFYYVALVLLISTYLLLRRLVASPVGATWIAIRENERRAAAIGYNVFAYKLLAITVAGVLAALAGAAHALFFSYVSPEVLGVDNTINVLLMTMIGGLGTLTGPVLGAVVVRAVGTMLSSYTDHWLLLFGVLYVAIVMFRPKGLLGSVRARQARQEVAA